MQSNFIIYKETDIIILYFSKHSGKEQLFKLSQFSKLQEFTAPWKDMSLFFMTYKLNHL